MTDLAAHVRLPAGSAAVTSPFAKATIRLVLIVTALAGITGGRAVQAQETASRPPWGDVGVGVSPLFKEYRNDVREESCCTPLSGWVTWGTGTFRLQGDFLYNHLRWRGHTEERQGRDISVQRVYVIGYADQVFGTALYWRVSEESRFSPHLLLGLEYWRRDHYFCGARGEPVVQIPTPPEYGPNALVYRVDFAEEEEQRCVDEPRPKSHVVHPRVGLGVDIPIGSRVFARAEVRGRGILPILSEVRMGVGVRF